jgi:replicative DNA helicase
MQSAILSYLAKILQENRVREFFQINPSDLKDTERQVFNFIKAHFREYGKLPSLELAISKTIIEPPLGDEPFGYYYKEFTNNLLYSKLTYLVPELDKLLRRKDIPTAVLKVREFLTETESVRLNSNADIKTMSDLGRALLEFIDKYRLKGGLIGVQSGWPTLDKATGGFQKGDIFVILARVKQGKSLVLLFMASVAHLVGYVPLFISMEMSALQTAKRYYAWRTGISMKYIKTGRVSSLSEYDIRNIVEDMKSSHPFYFVEGQFRKTIDDITGLIHGLKPDIVYIDAAYLIQSTSSNRLAKWERVTEIIESLKTAAMTCDIPIVVTFQLTRESMKSKDKGFEHVHLSDAIGQVASAGIVILDKNPYEDDIHIDTESTKYIELIGNREGEDKIGFYINWDWERMIFSEEGTNYEN